MSKDVITRLKAVDEMSGPIGQVMRNVGKFNQQCLSLQGIAGGVSKSLASMATSFIGPAAAIGALTTAIGNNIQTARQFEQSIAGLQSLTGMSGEALEDLKRKAIELGGSTTQTASQVAESFMLIGSKMPELLKDADALQTVTKAAIRLAEASGGDVTTSANALTAALNIMGEGASEAERYINVMAATSQQGTRNIQELTDIVFRAGQNARATGISFEELMAIAGAGTKEFASAEQAGQALGKLFLQLEKQGDNNLKPSVVGVTEAIKNLTAANFDTVTATKMFTKNGAAAYMSIIHNKDAILQLLPNIQGTNTALEQANTNTNTLNGSLNKLSSAWEQFNLQLNDSNGILKDCVDVMTDLLTVVNNIDVDMPELNGYWKEFATTLISTQGPLATVIANYDKLGKVFGFAKEQLHELATEMQKGATGDQKNQWAADAQKNFQAWRKKQMEARGLTTKPGLVEETPEFDDSTEEGIKAHIKYLKELRSTADIAGQEYGNLTAEITRLQNLLKNPDKTNTAEKTRIQEINAEIAKLEKEYISADETTRKTITDKIWWLDAEKQGIQSLVKAAHDMPQDVASQLGKDINGMSYVITKPPVFDDAAMKEWSKEIQDALNDPNNKFNVEVKAILKPTGSIGDKYKEAPTETEQFNKMVSQYDELNAKIQEGLANGISDTYLASAMAQLDALGKKIDEVGTKLKNKLSFDKQLQGITDNINKAASSFGTLGGAMQMIEDPAVQVAGIVMEAVANVASSFAKALKNTRDPWEWIAAAASGTAVMISTVAAIKSVTSQETGGRYAEGGLITGPSYVGDAVPIMANAGEVILNASQQEMLVGNLQAAGGGGGTSQTMVKGEQLITVINNRLKMIGKGDKLIG